MKRPRAKRKKPTPRITEDDLRSFVNDWCSGLIVSSYEVPTDLLPLVFFPLALSARGVLDGVDLESIGVIWERRSAPTMGRAINGWPMFKDDWRRAIVAIHAELERRAAIKV